MFVMKFNKNWYIAKLKLLYIRFESSAEVHQRRAYGLIIKLLSVNLCTDLI